MGWRRELARRRFDVALNLQSYFKGGVATALTRAPVRVGYDRARARDLTWLFSTHRLPPRPRAHVQDEFLEFLDFLGVPRRTLERWLVWFESVFPTTTVWRRVRGRIGVDVRDSGGPVVIDNSFGSIRVSEIRGNLKADGSHSKIDVRGIRGDADVSSAFGSIDISDVQGAAKVTNANGTVPGGKARRASRASPKRKSSRRRPSFPA